jgi:hypothetical protein
MNQDWPKIRNALLASKLGPRAKISLTPLNGQSHIICVYCPNFLDRDELLRVRRGILNDAKIQQKSILRFKADSYTYLDVYAHGKNKLKTSMYSCGGNGDLKCSTLLLEGAMCTRREGCPRCYPCCIELIRQNKLS